MSRRERAVLLVAIAACCALAAVLVARDLDRPGLYYDEVVQAVPAVEFLREGGRGRLPGSTETLVLGRWLPVMTQPYMGALKSQLLIPVFGLFDASAASLRIATLCTGLLGLALVVVWARRALGLPVALLTGLLLAVDPSFLFVSRHDWGSFAIGLLCRGAALVLLTGGWLDRSHARLLAGGACLGLGFYNKVDFAVGVAAALAALLWVQPQLIRSLAGERRRAVLALGVGFAAGAAPMLAARSSVVGAAASLSSWLDPGSPDWAEKGQTLFTMLDGSYFHRLMLAGGSFERLGAVEDAAWGPMAAIFVLALVLLTALLARDARRGEMNRAQAFVLAATLLTTVGILLTPRATRIHHWLNLYPLPQLVVSIAAVEGWRRARRPVVRAVLVLGVAAAVAGAVRVDVRTLNTIRETGGKGRWSDALSELGREIRDQPAAEVTSLDWGFDGPLRFADPALSGSEPFWGLRGRRRAALPPGTGERIYLVFGPEYAVFPYGPTLLEAVAGLPPGAAVVRTHSDRVGDRAFYSIRFTGLHQLVYEGGRISVRLR